MYENEWMEKKEFIITKSRRGHISVNITSTKWREWWQTFQKKAINVHYRSESSWGQLQKKKKNKKNLEGIIFPFSFYNNLKLFILLLMVMMTLLSMHITLESLKNFGDYYRIKSIKIDRVEYLP